MTTRTKIRFRNERWTKRRTPRSARLVAGATAALAVILAVAGCSGSPASKASGGAKLPGKPLASTTVLLDWFPNPDHIALYTAQKEGDFAAHGLSVTFQSPSDSTDAIKLVSLGKVPLAISYEPTVISAATDPAINVTTVAALVPVPLDALIISGKAGVASPGDLAGKSVGTYGDSISAAFYKLILARYGLQSSKTNLVTVSEGLAQAIIYGKVAGIIGGYRNIEAVQLKAEGLDPKVYPVTAAGVPGYDELVVIANKSRLASDPAYRTTVREFLAGLAQGSAAAQASPAAADAALAPVAKGYSPALIKQMVDATAPLLANPGGFGAMSATAWQSFATWMYHAKVISAPVSIAKTGLVNTSLLPKR